MKKIKLKIEGMHCTSCAMNIDGELEDKKGIESSNTNYAKQITEVEFDEEILEIEQIINAIKTTGYTAVMAEK